MNNPQIILRPIDNDLENRVYNVKLGNNQTIKVHVKQDFKIEQKSKAIKEILQVNCPEIEFILPYQIDLEHYYKGASLEHKMVRAAIEYGGTIDDMYSPGC